MSVSSQDDRELIKRRTSLIGDPHPGQTESRNPTSPQVETGAEPMRRWEAIAQIAAIPLAIVLGYVLLVIGWNIQ
jgi:hypothetical protein